VFYGIQTLRKSLVLPDKGQETVAVVLPAAEITDAPRFSYRGMHLDVARHFFSLDFVKQYIDMMVLHNMNTFHWHLTDDQGWRMEIKRYPKLAEIGGWRNYTTLGRNSDIDDGTRYGGYYTQQEMKEIVQYAKERFITVIPEIDMPGHMLGALTAYPELGCTGGPYEVEGHWGVFDDILCAGKEETFRFIEGVLEEVMDIFPSEYIHIGGDEAPRTRWEKCPLCQERIRKEHLTAKGNQSPEARLQGYFTKRVEAFVQSKGRKLIGWDELLDSDVNPSATIMSWRGVDGGLVASEKGHDVIMSPTSHCYFNFYLVKDYEWGEPYAFAEVIPIEKTYSFDPAPASLSEQAKKHILGAQGNLWSEYIHYNSEAEYQVLPRMGALSEVQWMQPSQKDFKAWVERERRLTLLYYRKGWAFAKHAFRK
jgi:hexosaminidase